MKKIYDHFRVVKITMTTMTLLVTLLTIISTFINSVYMLYFDLGSLFTISVAFIVIQITHSHNLRVDKNK